MLQITDIQSQKIQLLVQPICLVPEVTIYFHVCDLVSLTLVSEDVLKALNKAMFY